MTDESNLLWLFELIHGEMTGACYTEVQEDETGEAEVHCMKHGKSCWKATKVDLVFDYIMLKLR